jgi:hypothetical protein
MARRFIARGEPKDGVILLFQVVLDQDGTPRSEPLLDPVAIDQVETEIEKLIASGEFSPTLWGGPLPLTGTTPM